MLAYELVEGGHSEWCKEFRAAVSARIDAGEVCEGADEELGMRIQAVVNLESIGGRGFTRRREIRGWQRGCLHN